MTCVNRIEKDGKTNNIFAFMGEGSSKLARLCTACLSVNLKMLVLDASSNHRLFIATIGLEKGGVVRRGRTAYTLDIDYALEHSDEYDAVMIYDDYVLPQNFEKYKEFLNFVYLVNVADRYSIIKMGDIADRVIADTKIPFSFVFLGDERIAGKYNMQEMYRYFCQCRRKAKNRFYIPSAELDDDIFYKLDYGRLECANMSDELSAVVDDVMDINGIEKGIYFSDDALLYGV